MSTDVLETGWDRNLLDLSSKCVEPLVWVWGLGYKVIAPLDPNKFDNYENKIAEVARRALILFSVAFCLLTAPLLVTSAVATLGIASKVLRAIGFAFQNNKYTHVRGLAPEKTLSQNRAKVMTWNVCGIGGGLHYDHGGVNHWRDRLEGLIQRIETEDPDVLVLEEIYDTALAEALVEKLQTRYAHFFLHLGANVVGSVGGCMVLSKCAVHRFTNTSFHNNHWSLNRTFATLEIKARPEDQAPCARIIGTHFIHDDNSARIQQMRQALGSLEFVPPLPTVLMGDLNFERDNPEEGGVLHRYFEPGYLEQEPTCTNKMLKQWDETRDDPDQFIDDIALHCAHKPNVALRDVHLVRAFGPDFNTKTALSDHHGLAATLVW